MRNWLSKYLPIIGSAWQRKPGVGSAVRQFALTGLIALVLVGVISFFVLRRESTAEAIRDSETVTQLVALNIIEPALAAHPQLLTDPASRAAFDTEIRERVLNDTIVRVKIWTPDGRIVYSDRPELNQAAFSLSDEEREALATDKPIADVSDLTDAENEFERGQGKLLEVYMRIHDPNGQPLLVETYQRFAAVSSTGSFLLRKFFPIFLIGLLVLWLVQAPLAWSMAKRLRDQEQERQRLLLAAIESSDRERRRIASEVHDGPVQELAGIAFSLAGAADSAPANTPAGTVATLREGAAASRSVMRRLRGLLVEIHPPNLHAAGLEAAVSDLLAPLERHGVATKVTIDPSVSMTRETEALVFRGAQEAIRNATNHAHAKSVAVSLKPDDHSIVLEVSDDGRGFDGDERARRQEDGHLGLKLLGDLVAHAGGRVTVESTPGQGTTLRMTVPTP